MRRSKILAVLSVLGGPLITLFALLAVGVGVAFKTDVPTALIVLGAIVLLDGMLEEFLQKGGVG